MKKLALLIAVLLILSLGGALAEGNPGAATDPFPMDRYAAKLSAGGSHTVGLRPDGTAAAVGSDKEGQCDVDDWTDIVAVAAGDLHTVGLRSDGTMAAVGYNKHGQCDVGDWTLMDDAPAYPTLQKGAKGEDVARLQQALIAGGYLSGSADGDFGKLTEADVKAAQQALGLDPTGIADDAFQRMLYGE